MDLSIPRKKEKSMAEIIPTQKEEKKVDRRVQRTRQALRAALVELIREKGYDAISVEEITQRANLGRATFYLHYKDKDDILLEEFSEKVSDQVRLISEIPATFWAPDQVSQNHGDRNKLILPILHIFNHAAENAEFYRVMLRGQTSKRIADRINAIVVASYNEVIGVKYVNKPALLYQEIPLDILAVYFSGALLSCLAWWLEQSPTLSPEMMTLIFQNMYIPGVIKVMSESKIG
jgi:AcrR family transcriptional regulator